MSYINSWISFYYKVINKILKRILNSLMDNQQKPKKILPEVFFDIQINKENKGRITFQLYDDIVPKTCQNFKTLAQRQKPNGYKGSKFYKIVKDFALIAGDYVNEDGTGGKSIYQNRFFQDQNFTVLHKRPYLLTMNSTGPNTNSSEFCITTRKTPWLNKVNVVFGEVKTGFDLIDFIQKYGSKEGEVSAQIVIVDCGVIDNPNKKIQKIGPGITPPAEKLPYIFFQIQINKAKKGKIFFQLRDDIVPKTCLNFRTLALREKPNGYKGLKFYKVIRDFVCVSGDFQKQNGSGGRSIFSERFFDDQNFQLQHDKPYVLTMNNKGPNTNSSQFYITKRKTPWLNKCNVAFGQVVFGQDILQIMNSYGSDYGHVKAEIIIANTGNATQKDIEEHRIQKESQIIRPPKQKQPHVFFDISINNVLKGRIIFQLRDDIVPKTCLNFRTLAQKEKPHGYKGTKIYRIIHQFIIVGGDYINENGSGGRSIFQHRFFDDQSFKLSHSKPFLLTMGNEGPHTNSSQFYITKRKAPWLNDVHVVFGEVKQGFDVIQQVDKCGSDLGDVTSQIVIVDSGICEYVQPAKSLLQKKNVQTKEQRQMRRQKQRLQKLKIEEQRKAQQKRKRQQQKKKKLQQLKKRKFQEQQKKIENAKPKSNVYFQIEINKVKKGRIVFKLRDDVVPKTCSNFRTLAQRSKPQGYKGTKFYKIIKNLMCIAGDYINQNGTGGKSIFETKQFKAENFQLLHSKPYVLSMSNQGKNTFNSEFFITKQKAPWLNDIHVVFGQVVSGKEIVDDMNTLGTQLGEIKDQVVIIDSGIQ